MENKKRVSEKTEKIMEQTMVFLIICIAAVIVLALGKFALWIISL